jgi:hypothetical protein
MNKPEFLDFKAIFEYIHDEDIVGALQYLDSKEIYSCPLKKDDTPETQLIKCVSEFINPSANCM